MSFSTTAVTAIGMATLTKSPAENAVLCNVSGTYGTVAFTFQGTVDGSTWFNIGAIPSDTFSQVNGGTTISPTDDTTYSWLLPNTAGYTAVRANVSAIASGTFTVNLTGEFQTSTPYINVNTTANTQSGDLTIADAKNIIINTTTGTKIGTGTTQKIGFYNATPIVQPANTVDYLANLVNLGLRASGGTAAAAFPGLITSSSASGGIGYATGAGGAVSQATDRTTGVTVNTICGAITTQATSLAAGASVQFTVTNSAVAVGDVVVCSVRSGPTNTTTCAEVVTVAAGSFKIMLTNHHASVADTGAAIINFAVFKAVGS